MSADELTCTCWHDAKNPATGARDPDCPVHGDAAQDAFNQVQLGVNLRTSRSCLIENLLALPQSNVATDLADEDLGRWDELGESEFLDMISQWLIAYAAVATTARSTTAQMAEELKDWRTFATCFRKLITTGAEQ